jgi:hypothetical protein
MLYCLIELLENYKRSFYVLYHRFTSYILIIQSYYTTTQSSQIQFLKQNESWFFTKNYVLQNIEIVLPLII